MRKTKIVCTIGPASESREMLSQLMDAGMNVARLNFSHGTHEEHQSRIENIREIATEKNKTVAILLDTKGPEIRTHNMTNGKVSLERGQTVIVSTEEVLGTAEKFSVTYEGLVNDIDVGNKILLDDGLIELNVIEVKESAREIVCEVLNNGVLKDKKGVNVPNVAIKLPGMTDKDRADILFGIEQRVDFIAASFIRNNSDVLEIRQLLEENDGSYINIIPKIENQQGIDNINEILEVSEGLMVARGDMGVEIPPEHVPMVQKELIKICNQFGKPVITATQMLDSMQHNPRCTRAEASDVANAIYDGTDAVMLSGETAAGNYPKEAVETMAKIATSAEQAQDYKKMLSDRTKRQQPTLVTSIGVSVAHTALNLNCRAIVASTESGHTARMISKYRPKSNIIAVTPHGVVARQLQLVWGVTPIVKEGHTDTDGVLNTSVRVTIEHGYAETGDLLVITAGVPTGEAGTTNLMKLHIVGDVLIRAQGIGRRRAVGQVLIANSIDDLKNSPLSNKIVVVQAVTDEMTPYLKDAAALVTVEGGLTSNGAIVGLNLELPTIVGAHKALDILKADMTVTVDSEQNNIFNGHANVL